MFACAVSPRREWRLPMTRTTSALFAALALALAGYPAHAGAPGAFTESFASFQIGKTSIALPIPSGYADPTSTAPELRSSLERSSIAQKRFLAGYLSHADVEAAASGGSSVFRRYYVAHTLRASEQITVSQAGFDTTKRVLRDQFKAMAPLTGNMLSKLTESMIHGPGQKVMGTTVFLVGVFDETPSSISVTSVNTTVIKSGTAQIGDSTIVSITTALIRGKYVYLQVASDLSTEMDVLENQEASRAWTRAVLAANQ